MPSTAILLSLLVALAEARFGQEGLLQGTISALSDFGNPGDAATLAGATPGVLLAGANACDQLSLADKIVATLGNDAQVIAAAAQLVAAEKNFNPFAVSTPSLCSDATLPATAVLRGIVPLVDPAVTGSDVENANSAASLKAPFAAAGLSVADVAAANGFANFTAQAGAAGGASGAAGGAATAASAAAVSSSAAAVASPAPAAVSTAQQSTLAGLDFGLCVPTVKFEAGLGGRAATEFTFQAVDPLVNKGQQEALNPAIIFNRVCDQLTNVCGANQAAKDACTQAQEALGGGARDVTTADAWNAQLGFAGADTNPDNAPQAGLVGHA